MESIVSLRGRPLAGLATAACLTISKAAQTVEDQRKWDPPGLREDGRERRNSALREAARGDARDRRHARDARRRQRSSLPDATPDRARLAGPAPRPELRPPATDSRLAPAVFLDTPYRILLALDGAPCTSVPGPTVAATHCPSAASWLYGRRAGIRWPAGSAQPESVLSALNAVSHLSDGRWAGQQDRWRGEARPVLAGLPEQLSRRAQGVRHCSCQWTMCSSACRSPRWELPTDTSVCVQP